MGGKTTTTYIPAPAVQDNSAQIATMNQMYMQQQMYYDEMQRNLEDKTQFEADEAAAENLRAINVRQAEADAATAEREARAKKGKRDLLFMSQLGVEDEEDEDPFLLLGDN